MNVPSPNGKPATGCNRNVAGLKDQHGNSILNNVNITYQTPEGQHLPGVDPRLLFKIETGTTAATADAIVRHLIASGVGCYRGIQGSGLYERRIGGVRVTQAILRGYLERHCRFERKGKPCDPPSALVSAVQVSTVWPLPKREMFV